MRYGAGTYWKRLKIVYVMQLREIYVVNWDITLMWSLSPVARLIGRPLLLLRRAHPRTSAAAWTASGVVHEDRLTRSCFDGVCRKVFED